MLDLIYLVFIAPIEFCMKAVFEWGYSLTGSYGLALIGISLVVNTAVLPIYNKAEGWQEEERDLKKRMAPKEQMIRRCFKGQERFAMISTLYRQFGYSQFMTLRASIGILLQIPFFFAAYHLLSNMTVLNGVSFGPIRDLGAPDALFAIGGLSINVLPVLMTAVNLGSAFYYSHGLTRRDKIQLYGMAMLFLVLLYNSPAALTFYWTLNNVYSLGKNIVQKDWMKQQGWADFERKVADSWAWLGQKAGAFCTHVRPSRFPRPAYLRAIIALTAVIGCAYIIAKYGFQRGDITKAVTRAATVGAVSLAFLYGETLWAKLRDKVLAQKKELDALFLPAAGLVAFLIFVYCPFMVFSSGPVVFNMELENFASGRFGTFFVAMIALAVIHALIRPVRWVFGSISTLLALASLTFCFVAMPDVGVMDAFILQRDEVLTRWQNVFIDIAVFAAIVLIFVSAVYFYKVKILGNVVYAALTVLIAMTGVHYYTAKDILADGSQHTPAGSEGMEVPQYVKDFFTFSKNGRNIIVVMLDMFTGGNMNQILEAHPELKTELDGFTWFEDVVTGGSATIFGKPAILGGEACHPIQLNKDTSRSLEEKIAEAHGTFFRKLQEQNFTLSVYENEFFHPELLGNSLLSNEKTHFVAHKESTLWKDASLLWARKNGFTINKLQSYDKFWMVMGIFNVSPLVYKDNLYDKGRWKKSISKGNYHVVHAINQLSNLDLPSYASSISEEKKNSFIYMINLLTHVPWAIDEHGMPCSNGGGNDSRNLNNGGLSQEHLRTEYYALKALLKWFNWMKEHDVYDNTQIILVSDHGRGDSVELVKIWNGIPPVGPHGLLLVKENGKRGELCIDRSSQMGNWDVPHIILNSLCKDPGDRKYPWKKERARFSANTRDWRRENHKKNFFLIDDIYRIQGPLYDKKSWTKVN